MVEKTPTYVGPGKYAYKDLNGSWRAGPKSKKYTENQFVSEQYAKSVRASIDFRNRVKGLEENPSEDTPDTYQEAQATIAEFNKLDKELKKAQEKEDKQQIEDIEKEMDELREDLGSP